MPESLHQVLKCGRPNEGLGYLVRVMHAVRVLAREGKVVTPTLLSRRTGVRRTCVYRALSQLTELGMVAQVQRAETKHAAWVQVDRSKEAA